MTEHDIGVVRERHPWERYDNAAVREAMIDVSLKYSRTVNLPSDAEITRMFARSAERAARLRDEADARYARASLACGVLVVGLFWFVVGLIVVFILTH